MSSLFDWENPVMSFLTQVCNLVILNTLWIIFSIPIVTIGASTTALYSVTLKMVRKEEGYIIRSFLKAFKENFKQATIIWMISLGLFVVLGADWYFTRVMLNGDILFEMILPVIFTVLVCVTVIISIYAFPLQARFSNNIKNTLCNAGIMAIGHLGRTVLMVVLDISLLYIAFFLFPILVLLVAALIAYINSFVLYRIFLIHTETGEKQTNES